MRHKNPLKFTFKPSSLPEEEKQKLLFEIFDVFLFDGENSESAGVSAAPPVKSEGEHR